MVFRSPFPDVVVPDVSLHELLFGDLGDRADRVALVDGSSGASLSYRQLAGAVDRLAAALAERGIGKGDVVGILSPNTPYYAVVFHGILRAGATATTINALYTADEVAHQLSDAGAKMLFTVSVLLPNAAPGAEKAGVSDVVVLDQAEGYPNLTELLASTGPVPEVSVDPAEDVAVLPYSSGTTGKAKGVMLTHRNLVANIVQCGPLLKVDGETRILAVLPFFHIYGMQVLMNNGLYVGATVVTMPKFDLPEFLRVIQDHRTDRVYIAPPVAVALAKHPLVDQYDLSAIDTIFSGAAPLDVDLAAAVAKRLGCRVSQGYGMTEMSPVSHAIPDGRDDISVGTVGVIAPNMECRFVDPATGEDVGVGERGELWCRGPNVMKGYLNNPDATAATLDDEGWLHTGDVGVIDENGLVSIVDRVKELIKYKGYQVPPAELEALLLTHPEIADAAVVGVRDEEGEEVPKAFVVLQPGSSLDAAGVMDFVAAHVAPHKKVRVVEFIEAIPKSASGKILRKDLRARENA
ncbi:4-coumarate--CoA ligase family protein [Saccharothrix variisporea]|uniref:Acyl-CoA synthetase (AMP-forming)/AMP-acid ligase II n=1 Tax=Saccharothrix variisporea TaxID=543527 RepID=A0A495XJY1_9PSEU|nr:4-coumarate--CoA ligase family protein [Saccharothrix variisporea]RKT71938.1 acyl-CoA synthetase (AMP-forming)/AMP-acid ligase II [Saccharothrix variisporea]